MATHPTPTPTPQVDNSAAAAEISIVMVTGHGAYLDTLATLFAQARFPEKLQACVTIMADPVRDRDFFNVPDAIASQVTLVPYIPQYYRGYNWALSEALKQARGKYVLVVADQAAIQPHWDEQLLAALHGREESAMLTHFPAATAEKRARLTLQAVDFGTPERLFTLAVQPAEEEALQAVPIAYTAMMFGARALFSRVPFDPYSALTAAELVVDIGFCARLWTHGVDILQLPKSPLAARLRLLPELAAFKAMAAARSRHILGLAYSDDANITRELEIYAHGEARSLESFWEFAGVDVERRRLKPYAKQGHFDTQHAEPLEDEVPSQATIFVQIASYRDPECQHTVRDLFEKATYPDRITVGICWQSIPEEDQDCFQIVTRPAQVRVKHFDARQSRGACWARHHVQQLWQGEEYTLQIDSHMRFEKGWDVTLLDMLAACPSEHAVLSNYPPGYEPPDRILQRDVLMIVAKEFDRQQIFLMDSVVVKEEERLARPIPSAFAGACFLFGPARIIADVPYDPYLYFFGEEITLSVRLWTSGYDIFAPNQVVVYHDWKRERRKNTHFTDHAWERANELSFARVRYLLGMEDPVEPEVQAFVRQELDRYGLGAERSLQEYEDYSGVSFAQRAIRPEAFKGIFNTQAEPQARKVMVRSKHVKSGVKLVRTSYTGPVKTLEIPGVVVFDNVLPDDEFEMVYKHAIQSDYRHINTTGKVTRVWNIDNGFPLRSMWDHYYQPSQIPRPQDTNFFPTRTPNDLLFNTIARLVPQVQHIVGQPMEHWAKLSMSSWLYPPGTGLSLHNDGNEIYSGAYIYYLNRQWRIHWGGLLLVLDSEANEVIETHRTKLNLEHEFYLGKWLHETEHDDYATEVGFARCIIPKRNRLVFVAPDAYHIVTKVLPAAGDNVRMSLAGFFNRKDEKMGGVPVSTS